IRCRYIHSDVDTLERIEIIEDFQAGRFDVLIGVNLLREGLDLPQVSLVAILDADKEGFLRSETALTQTAGRAARNINGLVIMYADTITGSMRRTIDETNRRRHKQQEYNKANNITPTQIAKLERNVLGKARYTEEFEKDVNQNILQDPNFMKMDAKELQKAVERAKKMMEKAAADLDFVNAAKYRDEMNNIKKILEKKR
ncbi:MAG: UvrB/UvrC motif-containing protein, partial [Bacteroidales bacterium]|nr:UvrB/UvrC motif-containing protein [Bacteroidales bacterium]